MRRGPLPGRKPGSLARFWKISHYAAGFFFDDVNGNGDFERVLATFYKCQREITSKERIAKALLYQTKPGTGFQPVPGVYTYSI